MGRSGQTAPRKTATKTTPRARDLLAERIVAPQPEQQRTFREHRDDWEALSERVFAIGGDKIVMPLSPDDDMQAILERGQLWTGKPKMRRGKPCNCHKNSAYLFEDGVGLIATGYALSDDGYWRQHSWVVAHDGRVVETTTPRTAYFGVLFSEAECFDFVNQVFA